MSVPALIILGVLCGLLLVALLDDTPRWKL